MQNYLLIYHAGFTPITPADFQSAQAAWDEWFTGLGEALLNRGTPLINSQTVSNDQNENRNRGKNPAVGYSLIQAENRDAAVAHVKTCPLIEAGGDIQIAEVGATA